MFDTILKTRVDYDKSAWQGKSIFEYNPESKACEEFTALLNEVKSIIKLK